MTSLMDAPLDLSIVLPCYNEARNLPLILAGYVEAWRPEMAAELILVDNGSTDDTAAVLKEEMANPTRHFARVVRVEKNQGYGHGIFTGLQAARGSFLAFSHADMQCPPADVFRAWDALQATPPPHRVLVKGRRHWRGFGPALLTGGMTVLASSVLLTPLTDINAQPKLFPRELLERLQDPPTGFQFDLCVLHRARRLGIPIHTIPVSFGERAHGESKWAFSLASRWRTIAATARYIFTLRFSR
jgi:glycosyltransferase involved in cell wall biosynthesis